MMKSLKVTKPIFGVPSREVLDRIDTSDKVARLSEAGYAFEIKLRELERQFEAKASELRDGYLAEVCEINDGPDVEAA